MNRIRSITVYLAIFSSLLLLSSCNGTDGNSETNGATESFSKDYVVVSRELSDAQSLNLVNGQGEQTTYMSYHMQPGLLWVDFKKLEVVPILVTKMPELEVRDDGKLLIHYEIRPEATWDNGELMDVEKPRTQ